MVVRGGALGDRDSRGFSLRKRPGFPPPAVFTNGAAAGATEICTNELYGLMEQCWARNPEDRPTFRELVNALDVKKRKVYVNFNQLNLTYVFPPSDIENFAENPVQIVDIHM